MGSPDAIAYVLGTFPQPSQQFITREVRGLLAAGVPLRRFSPATLEPPDLAWFPHVRFTPRSASPSVIAANLSWLWGSPRRYSRALWTVITLPHRPRILRIRALTLFAVAAWIAREIARSGGCRHVHAHFALAQTEVAMVVAVLLGRSFSFTAHARDIYSTPSALPEKIRAAKFVVTCTAYNLEHLRHLCPDLPRDHVRLVHHGVDISALPHVVPPTDDLPLLVAAGRMIEKKGFDDLVAACALLRDRDIRFRCHLVGEGPMQARLARAVQQASLGHIVELVQWTPHQELFALMSRAAALVVPSRIATHGDRDGIPNVVLEAMGAGRPVVATRVSGIPEAVRDEVTGLLVPPGDPDALARAIERILNDRDAATRMGEAGRQLALEEFDLGRSSARLRALFAP